MTHTKFLRLLTIILFASAFSGIMSACVKDPGEIGLDLMDENDLNTSYSDTLSVYAHSVFIDSLRSDETSVNVIGSYCDPVFGTTTANMVAEFWMTENSPSFGTFPVADSVVFYLDYYGTSYGDTTTQQHVQVFELDGDIDIDSTYYSNRRCQYKPEVLGDYYFTPMPTDSVMDPDSSMGAARLAIPLNASFGQMILDSDTANLVDNETFTEFLNGLVFKFDPIETAGQGALLDMYLLDTRSEIVIYYHNSSDTSTFELKSSTYTPRYTEITHDFTTGEQMLQQQLSGDTTLGYERLYVQGLAGVKTVFRIPSIEALGEPGSTAVNEAKLIMELYEGDTTYAPPAQLEVMMYNEDDERTLIPDYSEGTTYYGGAYDSETMSYTFRITRYLQNVINGDIEDKGLELIISGGSINAERLVMYGTDPQDYQDDDSPRFRTQVIVTSIEN